MHVNIFTHKRYLDGVKAISCNIHLFFYLQSRNLKGTFYSCLGNDSDKYIVSQKEYQSTTTRGDQHYNLINIT